MHEVITDITTIAGSGRVSVMYFSDVVPPEEAVDYVDDFWAGVAALVTTSTSFRVRGTGRTMDEATGTLESFYTVTAPPARNGGQTGPPVPDAAQVLFQWRTGVVRNGREVRGRTFVPGFPGDLVIAGNVSPPQRTALATIGDTLAGPITGFGVWARPKEGSPGVLVQAAAGDVWSELAVLRRRRS